MHGLSFSYIKVTAIFSLSEYNSYYTGGFMSVTENLCKLKFSGE